MTRAELLALAARVEATGADRELDALVWDATGGAAQDFSRIAPRVCNFYEYRDRYAPAFTDSLDAAASLVPDDAFWRVGHDGDGPDPSRFYARVLCRHSWHGRAATPALALTAAALRARAEAADD